MPTALLVLIFAVAGFVGTHFLFSHIGRPWVVAVFGAKGFQIFYSLVALTFLVVIFAAYHQAPHGPIAWSSDNLGLQLVFDVVGYFAVALFMASLIGNPGLVGANLNGLSTRQPDGVFRITRHPMMFAIAIWLVVQLLIMPSPRNLIGCTGFVVLALLGSRLQDAKKTAQSGREWRLWVSRTPFWPDLRQIGHLGMNWLVAAGPWLLATWAEMRVMQAPIGVWYLFPNLPY
ncbi:MAG: NnrU family protein [Rudaea sp.]|nr:NnrU family protein [Rudaea sp.]